MIKELLICSSKIILNLSLGVAFLSLVWHTLILQIVFYIGSSQNTTFLYWRNVAFCGREEVKARERLWGALSCCRNMQSLVSPKPRKSQQGLDSQLIGPESSAKLRNGSFFVPERQGHFGRRKGDGRMKPAFSFLIIFLLARQLCGRLTCALPHPELHLMTCTWRVGIFGCYMKQVI